MPQTFGTVAITVRYPLDIVNSIDDQVKQTRQNKTDVIFTITLNFILNLYITKLVK